MTVEELLKKKNIQYIPKGADYVISCLNPAHPDKNPSMRVDQVTGIFNCFSCEFKGNIYTHFGQKPNALQLKREFLKRKIQTVRAQSVGLPFPKGYRPYKGNWRNIKPETYAQFEAFVSEQSDDGSNAFSNRLVFPVRDLSGDIVAFIGRHTGGGTPKYLNYPTGVKMPLFPVAKPINSTVILVEGIFDMLNLHDKGLTNAVCCFGVKNVTEDKLSVLQMSGVEHIDIFLDNDEAGDKGAQLIANLCDEMGLQHRRIRYGNKETDAGAMSDMQVKRLKEQLYS